MSFEVPDDLKYSTDHEWVETDDNTVKIGITDFAQDELGDVVFVELPDEGDAVEQDEVFGVVESIKAVSDLYSPVNGTVAEVNDDLEGQPELVNEDPFGDGWMLAVELADDSGLDELLSAEEYREQIE